MCPDRSATWVLGLALFAGCTGGLDELPEGPREVACEPGRVVARRLSRPEYNNTVHDLFEFDVGRPADAFPADIPGVNGLSVSDSFLEQHEAASEALAIQALDHGFITCDPGPVCAARILQPFMERAWRRPVTEAEVATVTHYLDVVAAEPGELEPFRRAVQLGIQHVLMSPNFLFRFEPLDDPTSLLPTPLGPYELASRLSYFIWETMPDRELFGAAEDGSLLDPDTLAGQVERMLEDGRSERLIERLSRDWLLTGRIDSLHPSPALFPDFDPALLSDMRTETSMFIGEFLRDDRSFRGMFSADFTYVNARLARHYGLRGADSLGEAFTRVSLAGVPERGGLLTQGAVLVATSVPRNDPTAVVSETSIIVRGEFVLRHLLCQALPSPPAGLDINAIQAAAMLEISPTAPRRVREGVRQARLPCSNCHRYIDPVGFSMEHYDITGAYRTTDVAGTAVDSSGTLLGPDGSTTLGDFEGARDLGVLLSEDRRVSRCLTEVVLTLALGHDLGEADRCHVARLAHESDLAGNGLRTLILSVIESEMFLQQQGEAP